MIQNPFRYFKTSREVIQLAVMMYVRFPLSFRNVEDLLHERGIDVCHESIRLWVDRFGPVFAKEIRSKRSAYLRRHTQWQWHLDEVFVKINGVQLYLWRAVGHKGEVLECFVTKKRDKLAALRFLKKAMKRYGPPQTIVTDRLRYYGAAMRDVGNPERQNTDQYANNRAENSHLPFRRRERGMTRFRRPATLQKFTSTHASVYNHFNHQRHLESRARFKTMRDVSLMEWRQLVVA
ncbi:IS6 family transposase [Algimonas arctica]|uniref:IS6 family transposase n=1 Tax=Algimonas arctica TaxID=1479486 RepID=A0A8J3CUW1_9PROT|nr:IS6 family transposase [Algimonas arctica]GHB05345.1 IS6 family transposase [Algimonas arctica]